MTMYHVDGIIKVLFKLLKIHKNKSETFHVKASGCLITLDSLGTHTSSLGRSIINPLSCKGRKVSSLPI